MYWVFKAVLKPLLLVLYRIRVEGLENVPRRGGAVIAANHLSFLDSFFIPLVIKRRKVTYLAKADYFESPKTAWFFRSAGQIPIEREGGRKSEQALDVALQVLREGRLLGIYPEGTRSPDGRLHRGRTGVARLALTAGTLVVPCGLIGTDVVMPRERKLPRFLHRGRRLQVVVRFGKPLDFSRYAGRERDRFVLRNATDEIVYEIMRLSGQVYVDQYASRSPALPMPESRRAIDEIDLCEEALVG